MYDILVITNTATNAASGSGMPSSTHPTMPISAALKNSGFFMPSLSANVPTMGLMTATASVITEVTVDQNVWYSVSLMPSSAHSACTIMGMNTEHSSVNAELPTSYIIHFFSMGVKSLFLLTLVCICHCLRAPAGGQKIIRSFY